MRTIRYCRECNKYWCAYKLKWVPVEELGFMDQMSLALHKNTTSFATCEECMEETRNWKINE